MKDRLNFCRHLAPPPPHTYSRGEDGQEGERSRVARQDPGGGSTQACGITLGHPPYRNPLGLAGQGEGQLGCRAVGSQ